MSFSSLSFATPGVFASPDELLRALKPAQADFQLFERRLAACMEGDSPLITSIARHLLQVKGKRIRPAILFLSSRAAGLYTDRTVDASLAIELIHTATLLHDDVVDESHLRRNQETVNAKWTNLISVLMGDYLFAKAFRTMVGVGSMELIRVISSATERVSVGELRQIEETGNVDISEEQYLRVISGKTASLFNAACQVGPMLAGKPTEMCDRFGHFGEALGVSFQISDDVLDYVGDASVAGKAPGNDLMTGKITLPLIHALRVAPPDEAASMKAFVKAGVSQERFPHALEFVERHGGLEYASQRSRELSDEALTALGDLPENEYSAALYEIVRFSTRRSV